MSGETPKPPVFEIETREYSGRQWFEKRLPLRSKTRVRIKVVLLLLAVLSAVGCASNSGKTERKGALSGMPEVTVDVPEKKVKATIRF